MVKRTTILTAWVCVLTAAAAFGQNNQGTGFLFQVPGAGSTSSRLITYVADRTSINPDVDITGPNGTYKIIPTPNGNKFYLLSDATLQALDGNLSSFRTINGIVGAIRSAEISPDGKYLIILASTIYILNTQTDVVVATGLGITETLDAVAVDNDSKNLFVATRLGFAGNLTKINLSTFQKVGTSLTLPFTASSLAFSPKGILYAVFANRIMEIDPDKLVTTTPVQFQFSATPGPLRFTPSGDAAYLVNLDPTGPGRVSLVKINIKDHTTSEWPPFNPNQTPPTFTDVYIAGEERIFTYAPASKTIFEIPASVLDVRDSTLTGLLPLNKILGMAVSNEVPSSRFLYALAEVGSSGQLLRVDLGANTISSQTVAPTTAGQLLYVSIPPQTGATTISLTNADQVVAAKGQSLPLIARVLDGVGRPVYNIPVIYSTDPNNGVVIDQPNQVTTTAGRTSAIATLPSEPGTYVITVTAGAATSNFRLSIPGAGGGIEGGKQFISIINGDGQLVWDRARTPVWAPLTVRVVDAAGQPRANATVTFSIIDGGGGVNPTTTTDTNGIAFTPYAPPGLNNGISFVTSTIRATTDTGSVDFKATTFRVDQGNAGPELTVLNPSNFAFSAGRGETVNAAVNIKIISTEFPQIGAAIPFVSLRTGDLADPTKSGPGACVGNSYSDNLGVARCNYKASCTIGTHTEYIIIGELRGIPFDITIGPGKPAGIASTSGDLQSGRAGQTLQDLVATITDGCGAPISGATVSMVLVQGSATLTPIRTVSDANGIVSARVLLGSTPGPVQVRFTLTGQTPVIFNLTNTVVVGSLTVAGGTGQSALFNQAFGTPVTFLLRDNNNNPIPNAPVTFSISGPGSISPVQANTGTDGRVQTAVTAGNAAGTITVTASYNTFNTTVTLQVRPPGPVISNTSFVNAASLALGMVPCGLTTVTGAGIAPTVQGDLIGANFGPMPYSLGDIDSIFVGNVPAPIRSLTNRNGVQQATFQTPCETPVGSAVVRIRVAGTESTASAVPVFSSQPGIFTFAGPNNLAYGAVIRAKDGSYITPSNLAPVGERFYLVVTGLGQTSPASTTNSPGQGSVIVPVVVGIKNSGLPVFSAKPLPGYTGVYLVEFEIPLTAPQGTDQPLGAFVTVNGQIIFGNNVFIPGVSGPRQ